MFRIARFSVVVPLVLLLAASALAQADRFDHEISVGDEDQKRSLTVQLPESYAQTQNSYPVLYVLDGENNLDYAASVATFLAETGATPEFLVVGLHAGTTRALDYLPAGNDANTSSGRAHEFLRYLKDDIVAFVEENYRAAPLRVISGHSYGGIFVTYAMLEAPDLFHGYLTQSPYLDEAFAAPLLSRIPELENQQVGFYYLSLGDEPQLQAGFDQAKQALAAQASDSFQVASHQFAGQTHMTTRLVGHYDGLERMFANDWKLTQAVLVQGRLEALTDHIARLSNEYGYEVLYGENGLQQATQIFMALQDWNSAAGASDLYVELYPQSPLAHFLRASALSGASDIAGAKRAVEIAIALYEAAPSPELVALVPAMRALEQSLAPKVDAP